MLNLSLFAGTGIGNMTSGLVSNWIGPAFLLIVAGVSITFLIRREIRQLIIFVIIAAIVGMLVYGGSELFGQNKGLNQAAQNVASSVNVIVPTVTSHVSSAFTSIGNFIH